MAEYKLFISSAGTGSRLKAHTTYRNKGLLYTEQAKQAGATIISLSANNESKISNIADKTICYTVEEDFQLMKTSYEQFSFLFWDFVAQKIIVSGNLNVEKIEYNHSILE